MLLLSGMLSLFVLARCGGDSFSSSGAGGTQPDSGSGGAGGSSAGGTNTGGSATGGSATGGSATGGSATGGSATGGSATGGNGGTGTTDAAADAIGPTDATTIDAPVRCGVELNTASHTIATNVAEVSVPHTVAPGKPLLVVTLALRHDNNVPNTIPYATGISYAGYALTKLKVQTDLYYQSAEIWALVGPPAGSGIVNAHFSAAPKNVALGAVSFTGVVQDTTFGTPFNVAGLYSTLNVPVASPGYAAFVDVLSHSTPYDWTAAAPQTPLWTEGNTVFGASSSFGRVTSDTTATVWNSTATTNANVVLLGVAFGAAPCP
jgi:hypothetical protein